MMNGIHGQIESNNTKVSLQFDQKDFESLLFQHLSPELQTRCDASILSEAFAGPSRLRQRLHDLTLPKLGEIYLMHAGTPADIQKASDALYVYYFGGDEAEDVERIHERRKWMDLLDANIKPNDSNQEREKAKNQYGQSRYYQLIASNLQDQIVAQSFFSLLPMPNNEICVYLQYICVADDSSMTEIYSTTPVPRPSMRGLGVAALLQVIHLSLAAGHGKTISHPSLVGTIFESEMKGQATTLEEIRYTRERLRGHTQSGARILMLEMPDGQLQTPHCQPRLGGPQQEELMMHLLVRPTPTWMQMRSHMSAAKQVRQCENIMLAYLKNFDQEGFSGDDVARARKFVQARFTKAVGVKYLSEEEVGDIVELARLDDDLEEQVVRSYGQIDLHEQRIRQAFGDQAES